MRRERGSVAVEFALLLPLLVALLLGIADYGIWYSDSISLRSAAREGARLAVVDSYPTACASESNPARRAACAAIDQATLIGGTPEAKVFVEGSGGRWDQGNRLIVCTTIKEDGLSGLSPLPNGGVLRTRVAMRLETDQGGTSQVAGNDPSEPDSGDWDWC
jgi:Flp pilus assembly protein TadG